MIAAAIALLAVVAGTQADPPARISATQLLERVAAAYARCATYRDAGVVTTRYRRRAADRASERPFATAFVRSGRFRFEYGERSRFHDGGRIAIWAAGGEVKVWYAGSDAPHARESLERELAGEAGPSRGASVTVPALLMPDRAIGDRLTEDAPEGEPERVVLDGVDCWRLELRHRTHARTVWIDARRYLVLRIDERDELADFATEETTTYAPVVNEEIPEELLALEPPERGRRRFGRMHLFFALLPLAGLAAGCTLAILGWRALQIGRPFTLSTRWLFPSALLFVALEPAGRAIDALSDLGRGEGWGVGDTLFAAITLLTLAAAVGAHVRSLAGYAVFGVTEAVAREALAATLDALEQPHQVKGRVFRLTASGVELELSRSAFGSLVRILPKKRADAPEVARIVEAMRACFRSESVALSRTHCIFYVVAGIAIAALAAFGALWLW